MKTITIILALLLSIPNSLRAQSAIGDPIHDFLFTRNVDKDPYLPELKRLFILKVDINNNGHPVTLLSFNGYGGKEGNFWSVYIPQENGRYQKADESTNSLFFRPDVFYVGYVAAIKQYGLLAYLPGENGGDLNLFQIVDGKVTEQKIASVDLSQPKDKQEFESYFGDPPNWKSLKNYSVKILDLGDLKNKGYDANEAIKAAQAANHPLYKPLTNQ